MNAFGHKGPTLAAAALLMVSPLSGQVPAEQDGGPGFQVAVRAGMGSHGTGSEGQCGDPTLLSLGGAVATSGDWIIMASADVLASWGLTCAGPAPLTVYEGQSVEIRGTNTFELGPRLAGHVGRRIRFEDVALFATGGIGVVRTTADFGFPAGTDSRYPVSPNLWMPWYGVSMGLELASGAVSVEIEVGRHRLERRYYAEDGSGLLRTFHLWRTLTHLGVSSPVWRF